ncbi:MAG TPA: molybdopterin-dependent oxidoreductase [Dongiaceae bacterium]|nr:molybdopterin-dependent oxidoreductase [Dongiaceae bacterium]
MAGDKTIIRTTCPRDCYDSCGIAVIKRRGVITKVLGDPDHPVARGALCGKCALAYNGVWRDPAYRLQHPLKRIGPKGEGRFAAIGWDEALGEIAGRLRAILTERGPAGVWHTHYTGTCSLIAGGFPVRFFNRVGASEIEPDSICNLAGHVALDLVFGSSYTGFDPRTARDSACILVWGANPSSSAPHAHKQWLPESPARKIVIDPIRHATAAAADLHLQPFPGSDAALAFALLHVIRREGLIDRGYLARNALGWEEVEAKLDACGPAWGESVTGLPAALIEEAARIYGRGPSLMWLGQGLQRQPMGGNVFRAAALLPAATGNLGKPGAGFYYLNGGGRKGLDGDYLAAPHLRRVPERKMSHMDLASDLADPARMQALFCWNINIAASNPDQRRLHQALRREDLLTVVLDLFQTDTADFADFILPAASFLEFDDIVSPYFNLTLSPQQQAAEPMGESLPNQEIFRRLARAMGFNEPELFEDDQAMLDRLCAQAGIEGGFEALKARGTVQLFAEPVLQFADGKFPTPSGKIEIASARAAAMGLPRIPLPHADPRPAAGHLRLLSPASAWAMNTSYGNDPHNEAKIEAEGVTLHPADAAGRGLVEGAMARLANEAGEMVMPVHVDAKAPPGVALAVKGAWPKLQRERRNINVLHAARKADMGESTSVHGIEVTVTAIN